MLTLGLSYGFHDSSAALVRDGRVVCSVAEERLSREKHDEAFPRGAVEQCLAMSGVTAADLDLIAYHESPPQTFTRVIASSLASFPHTHREFTGSMKAWLGRKIWTHGEISKRLGVDPKRIVFQSHHESHVAAAFLGSGFEDAAVLTIDAVGEWATTTSSRARRVAGKKFGVDIEALGSSEFPNSLGLFYSAFTAYLGFLSMDGECSVMALAAFGKPSHAATLRRMIRVKPSGALEVDQRYFNFTKFYAEPWSAVLVDALGAPRRASDPLPFDSLQASPSANVLPEQRRFADIAASVQLVFEECVLELAEILRRKIGARDLCFAGGAALNCVANARLSREGSFDRVFVPPDPGDGGSAVGAALLASARCGLVAPSSSPRYKAFSGPKVAEDDVAAMLPFIDPRGFRRHAKIGYEPSRYEAWSSQRFKTTSTLTEAVAKLLHEGAIVGWCQGRSESGPRALGARSILIRPGDVELARRLSRDVKDRAAYRPYALSMTHSAAGELLDVKNLESPLLRWMQAACPVRAEKHSMVRAGLHVDGTTRPQIVDAAEQPEFHALLTAFGALRGTECLINTSFNESGAPLVHTAVDALAVFARTGMDALVIGDLVISKSEV